MSAFLGPIHYWLYNKISLQEEFIKDIVELSKEFNDDLQKKLDDAYGRMDTKPLEDIIDQSNIHGWLQERIAQTELKLAFSITKLLEIQPEYISKIEKIAYSFGEKYAVNENTSAEECFKLFNDMLIDGMPCDRVNEIIESDNNHILWKQTRCVHGGYWNNVDGDVSVYYKLRYKIIEGILSKSHFEFYINEEGYNIIKRK